MHLSLQHDEDLLDRTALSDQGVANGLVVFLEAFHQGLDLLFADVLEVGEEVLSEEADFLLEFLLVELVDDELEYIRPVELRGTP